MARSRMRRQDLTPNDVRNVAIWEFTLREKVVGPNQGGLRARPDLAHFDHSVVVNGGTVRARITFADGAEFVGIVSPVHRSVADPAGYLQPALLTSNGQVHFWTAREPTEQDLRTGYALLGRSAEQVFPLTVRADVPLATDMLGDATMTGFRFREHYGVPLGGGLKRGAFRTGEVR